jgi:hypothetical protein
VFGFDQVVMVVMMIVVIIVAPRDGHRYGETPGHVRADERHQ